MASLALVLLFATSIDGGFISPSARGVFADRESQNGMFVRLHDKDVPSTSSLCATNGVSPKQSDTGSNSNKRTTANFEYQELKVQLQAMQKQGIRSRDLMIEKKMELTGYIKKVIEQRPSLTPLGQIGSVLPNTKWRLAFSTDGATMGDLPRDATIQLEFVDSANLDYVLQFSKKTLGLNRIVAKSTWTVDPGPVNPGLLTFVYDQIITDVFGLSNLPVGFFGLLKGRANYVESSYFDGTMWIERGYSPEGQEYFNVYLRDD